MVENPRFMAEHQVEVVVRKNTARAPFRMLPDVQGFSKSHIQHSRSSRLVLRTVW